MGPIPRFQHLVSTAFAIVAATIPAPARSEGVPPAGRSPQDTAASIAPTNSAATASARTAERLAGRLSYAPDLFDRWCWAGTWNYPVGSPTDFSAPDSNAAPGFRILRGVQRESEGDGLHQGTDLANRRGGDWVRAAASGLVVSTSTSFSGGYGQHVVIAHRLDQSDPIYTVYAHLAAGSIRLREGDVVEAGEPIGQVGRTGRASTEHLHFEVRRARNWNAAWEEAAVEDPLAFVAERLPAGADSAASSPWLDWAKRLALVSADVSGDAPLERAQWWSMLARAARHSLHDLPSDLRGLRNLLDGLGVRSAKLAPHRIVPWSEMRQDLARLATVGLRVPHVPASVTIEERRAPAPAQPTVLDACAALAALATESRSTAAP